ncbi:MULTISPECIES: GNAT family N-acetyltransferase [Bacillaceae]|uniref:GNAT family N-acetyltransferase n=1 Tax=Bacillaceae TaxID=186817 RepID=UPI0005AB82E0|nr:GNAT family N-acetyltransferase [Bacillus rubiinfantis]
MDIRKPTNRELKQIFKLSPQVMFEGTLGKVKPTNRKIKQLVTPLLKYGSFYLIATEDDKLMGWILIGENQDQFTDKKIGFIFELYILEKFRGKRISQQLLSRAIDHFKKEGYPEVRLNVFVGNSAINIYEKMGFNARTVTMGLLL